MVHADGAARAAAVGDGAEIVHGAVAEIADQQASRRVRQSDRDALGRIERGGDDCLAIRSPRHRSRDAVRRVEFHKVAGWCALRHGTGWVGGMGREPDAAIRAFRHACVDLTLRDRTALLSGGRANVRYDAYRVGGRLIADDEGVVFAVVRAERGVDVAIRRREHGGVAGIHVGEPWKTRGPSLDPPSHARLPGLIAARPAPLHRPIFRRSSSARH